MGRTHSLPNDSYMFLPPFGQAAPAQLLAQTQRPQHILGTHRAQSGNVGYAITFQIDTTREKCEALITSMMQVDCQITHCARLYAGSSGSVRSQPEEFSQQLTVPTDLFRPISPHSHSDSESIPRLPPPRRTHTLSRTLRRQVTKSQCYRFLLSWSIYKFFCWYLYCYVRKTVFNVSGVQQCAIKTQFISSFYVYQMH